MSTDSLTTRWDRKDYKDVQGHNRRIWKGIKKKLGVGKGTPVRGVPGFYAALQEMEDAGYSLTDQSAVFGLSRERIRQYYANDDGLIRRNNGAEYRLWDDERNRFTTRKPEEVRELFYTIERSIKRAERIDIIIERQAHITAALKDLAAPMDRQPTLLELAESLGYTGKREGYGMFLTIYWLMTALPSNMTHVMVWDAIYTSAGIDRQIMVGKTGRYKGSRGRGNRFTSEQCEEIRLRVKNGESYASISRDLNTTYKLISRVVRQVDAYAPKEY